MANDNNKSMQSKATLAKGIARFAQPFTSKNTSIGTHLLLDILLLLWNEVVHPESSVWIQLREN